jgi:hypothetical protein
MEDAESKMQNAKCKMQNAKAHCQRSQGVTRPVVSTPKANPGSGPDPGVVTI